MAVGNGNPEMELYQYQIMGNKKQWQMISRKTRRRKRREIYSNDVWEFAGNWAKRSRNQGQSAMPGQGVEVAPGAVRCTGNILKG